MNKKLLLQSLLLFHICILNSCAERPHAQLSPSILTQSEIHIASKPVDLSIPQYTLSNTYLQISCIPQLGAKITSIKHLQGREFLSRSKKPYTLRHYGMHFGQTEVDGIDECFPAMNTSRYPTEPWKGQIIPDHGEIYQLPWTVDSADNSGLLCSVRGKAFPYIFSRKIQLEDHTIILDYRVQNLSDHDFHCTYTFHPLFAGASDCQVLLEDDTKILLELSSRQYLGRKNSTHTWGTFTNRRRQLFKDHQYTSQSRRIYQYYTTSPAIGNTALRYQDGSSIQLHWPKELFPHLGVWCNQARNPRVEQIACEPSNSIYGKLEQAYAKKQHLSIAPHSDITWQIRLHIQGPIAHTDSE